MTLHKVSMFRTHDVQFVRWNVHHVCMCVCEFVEGKGEREKRKDRERERECLLILVLHNYILRLFSFLFEILLLAESEIKNHSKILSWVWIGGWPTLYAWVTVPVQRTWIITEHKFWGPPLLRVVLQFLGKTTALRGIHHMCPDVYNLFNCSTYLLTHFSYP